MAKEAKTGEVATATGPDDFPIGINEFCIRLSGEDRRVEMIGAFHCAEQAAGRMKDTDAQYRARFVAFCSAPA